MNYTTHTQIIDIYFNEIRKNQSLTAEDEKTLFARVAAGDKTAESEICNRMAKMAVAEAKKYTGNPDLLCDLIQEANIGVLTAIGKFDITKGYRFSSYARWWMKAMIINCLEMMNIVQRKCGLLDDKVRKIRREFENKMGKTPSEYEVLDILEGMGEKVNDLTLLHELCVESLNDIYASDDKDEEKSDRGGLALELSTKNEYEEKMESDALLDLLTKKMSILTEREKKFVALKFGIGVDHEYEYDVIADMESVYTGKTITSERVRQIVKSALAKMR